MKLIVIAWIVLWFIAWGLFFALMLSKTWFLIDEINNWFLAFMPPEVLGLFMLLFFWLIIGLVYAMFVRD